MRNALIVVGVDGSEGGRRALRWAMQQAFHSGAAVEAITAWGGEQTGRSHDRATGEASERTDTLASREDAVRLLEREVQRVLDEWVSTPPPLAREVVEGQPAQVLVEAATDAAMLVLGSHGHGNPGHVTLGSVTEACVRHGSCPVVVVPVPHPERYRHEAQDVVPIES